MIRNFVKLISIKDTLERGIIYLLEHIFIKFVLILLLIKKLI